jgi:hypothetical protein
MARAPAPTVALLLLLAGLPAPARAQEIPEGAPAQPQAHRDREQAVGWFRHLFPTAPKTVVLAVEYETPLDPVAAQGTIMMVGVMLSYYFSW